MNKEEFISELEKGLQALSLEERKEAIKYYRDYFEDAGEENEQSVINELGSASILAKTILKENGYKEPAEQIPASGNAPKTTASTLPGWALALIIVGASIFGFPVIVTAVSLVFAAIMTIIGLFIGLFAAAAGILISGIALLVYGLASLTAPAEALVLCGVGFILTGFGLILGILALWLSIKMFPAFVRGIVYVCRLPFKKRSVNV